MPTIPRIHAKSTLPGALWALMLGNFVIGTGVMVVPGTLNDISQSLGVSVAAAGQLISAAALLMCVCAPLLAGVVAGWDRRRLLSVALVWYGVLHLLCALAPDYASLLVLRVLAVVSPAVFTPQAAACVGQLVPAHQQGRAITFVFLGWSVASVLGMPLGAWIGGTLGWRWAFVLVGVLTLGVAVGVWRTMPDGVRPPALSRSAWRETLGSPALMLCVGVTTLYAAGQFVQFSYFAPYFHTVLRVSTGELSLLFIWFGAFGFLGNVGVSRTIDRIGPARAVMLGMVGMAISLLLWPLGQLGLGMAAAMLVPWALGCFSSNSAQQARLVHLAPALASASIALNTSAMYAGQALGAAAGGWLIAQGNLLSLHWFGLGGILLAMALSHHAARLQHRR